MVPLQFRHRSQGSMSSFIRGVRPQLMLRYRTPLSSHVVKRVSGLLSITGGEFGRFLEFQHGSQISLHVVMGYLGSIRVDAGESGLVLC